MIWPISIARSQRRLPLFALLALALIVLFSVPPAAEAAPAPQAAVAGQAVIDALKIESEVAVDIALRALPSLAGRPLDVEALKSGVAALQDGALAALTPSEFRLDRKFSAVPAFTGAVTQSGLDKLLANPNVLKVDLPAAGRGHLGQVVPLVEADEMHNAGFTGNGVVVAVLDSGLDTDHTDLANDLVGEECFNDCPNNTDRQSGAESAEDGNGHGTNVTGIITSTGSVSAVGVAPDADIFAYKVLNAANGFASLTGNVVVALDDIIANHPEVDLVNMSLGTFSLFSGNCDATAAFNIITATAIDTLRANGVTSFASSGNQASGTQMSSPACIANTLAVGATYDANIGPFTFLGVCSDASTSVDQVTCFTNSNSTTDIFAPGCRATSTGLANGTSNFCGTSQASPTSVGCAALLLDQDPTLTPAQTEARLEASDVSVTDATNGLSFPRIDCFSPVGGIAELADVDPTPLETSGPGPSPGVLAGAAAGAGALAVAGLAAAWWAKRRSRSLQSVTRTTPAD